MEYTLLEIVLLVLISVLELMFGKEASKGRKLGLAMVHSSFRKSPPFQLLSSRRVACSASRIQNTHSNVLMPQWFSELT